MKILRIHHIAIICSDYTRSKEFYTRILGCSVVAENYQQERGSWKLDLAVNGNYQIELFGFAKAPPRQDRPEARGLRHLAFAVPDVEAAVRELAENHVETEAVRIDPYTGGHFVFFRDPDGLPIELYETAGTNNMERKTQKFTCRPGCAACCIHISISSSIPGMPYGKPAGVRCANLDDNNLCVLHGTKRYPPVCRNFTASSDMCGSSYTEAAAYLIRLEEQTS